MVLARSPPPAPLPARPCSPPRHLLRRCVQLCSLPSVRRFQIWGSPYRRHEQIGLQTFEFNVTERTEYTLALLTCASIAHDEYVSLQMDVTMVNPNNEHLSIEKRPLEPMYWALGLVYMTAILVSAYSYAPLIRQQVLLQCLMGAVVTKWLEVLLNLAYYRTLSTTGRDYTGLLQVTKLGDVLTNSAFMAFLLLVSLGWTITRNVLTRRERQLLMGFFSLYGIFGLLHSICTTPAYCQVPPPRLFLSLICRFVSARTNAHPAHSVCAYSGAQEEDKLETRRRQAGMSQVPQPSDPWHERSASDLSPIVPRNETPTPNASLPGRVSCWPFTSSSS
eukprot:Tamp_13055.p1 GENE.Tamp_13055~~Tamp_13055.p1  ORF type:complete len:334 (-),score=31.86 Tamp_13055:110-1111(-)